MPPNPNCRLQYRSQGHAFSLVEIALAALRALNYDFNLCLHLLRVLLSGKSRLNGLIILHFQEMSNVCVTSNSNLCFKDFYLG